MGDIFGPEGIDDGSFDGGDVGDGGGDRGDEGRINITQTVNQNQDQGQNQQQQQQQDGLLPRSGFIPLGIKQHAKATNQNVVVGNTGAVQTGQQNANAVNVGLGLAAPATDSLALPVTAVATSVSYSSNPSTGYSTHVIATAAFVVTIVTPPGVGALPTVTIDQP
jgi:hypothetical protein